MTSAAKTELQVGRLSPEDAERFASMFRPAWELDDAPFASGTKLSAAEMDALAGNAGVSSEIQSMHSAPRFPPARTDSKPPEANLVVVQQEPLRAAPAPAPAVAQQAPPVPAAKPKKPPPPAPVVAAKRSAPTAVDHDEFAPPKKSNTALFAGIAVVGLLVVGGLVAKFAIGGDAPKTNTVATQATQTAEERHIPPPPEVDTSTATTAATTTATATTTAAPTTTAASTTTATVAAVTTTTAAPIPTTTAAPVQTHTAAATATARPTATAAATVKPGGTGKPNTGKGTGGIVRDTPF